MMQLLRAITRNYERARIVLRRALHLAHWGLDFIRRRNIKLIVILCQKKVMNERMAGRD